jgi:hypothetical protein
MDINTAIAKILDQHGEAIVTAIRGSLANSRKIATGDLQNSVQYEVKEGELLIWANDYFKYVEDGRRGNAPMPPINAILEWLKAKDIPVEGITSRVVTNHATRKTRIRRDNVELSQKKAAFRIAKGIAKNGIRPTGVLRPILNEIQDPLLEAVSQAVANSFGEAIADEWKNSETDKLQIQINFD